MMPSNVHLGFPYNDIGELLRGLQRTISLKNNVGGQALKLHRREVQYSSCSVWWWKIFYWCINYNWLLRPHWTGKPEKLNNQTLEETQPLLHICLACRGPPSMSYHNSVTPTHYCCLAFSQACYSFISFCPFVWLLRNRFFGTLFVVDDIFVIFILRWKTLIGV